MTPVTQEIQKHAITTIRREAVNTALSLGVSPDTFAVT